MYCQQTTLQPPKVSRKMFCRVFLFEASVTVVTCDDEKLTQSAAGCLHPTHKQGCEGAQHSLRLLSVSVMPDTLLKLHDFMRLKIHLTLQKSPDKDSILPANVALSPS